MHTVPELVLLLGLSTENQVRNRIEAVRDLLLGSLRRGPNNQILLSDEGLGLLRDLQALCETGHTLAEASNILRFRADKNDDKLVGGSPSLVRYEAKPNEAEPGGWPALVEHLAAEVRGLAGRVAALEAAARRDAPGAAWWERWR